MMKRDYATLLFKAGLAALVLALLVMIFVFIAPAVLGPGQISTLIQNYVPIGALLLVLFAVFVGIMGTLLLMYEVATAKNENLWKLLWLLVLLCIGFGIGVAIYYMVGRKEKRG